MGETLKVWSEGRELELSRDRVWLFDRSRYLLGQTCPQKRHLSYHWGGRGLESAYRSEDLSLGSAVHWGLERMLTTEVTDVKQIAEIGAEAARAQFLEDAAAGIAMQDDERFGEELPEVARLLAEEQAALAYALVWTFGRRHLASLLERYEVVAVEPEVAWLVGWTDEQFKTDEGTNELGDFVTLENIPIVMMSRPDAVLRSRDDGKLWTVSWKTTKMFTGESVEKLECDLQGVTEGLAVRHWLGEPVAGTFYTYLVKGAKYFDKDTGVKRYTSPLVRPYCLWSGVGEPRYSGQYQRAKGWERQDVWKSLDMADWLAMLDAGLPGEEAEDYLAQAVAEPLPQPFVEARAVEWLTEALAGEQEWMREGVRAKHSGSCFNYTKRCAYYDICWRLETVEGELARGRKRMRETANHAIEFGGEGGGE